MGDYRKVRNVRTTVERAVDYWIDIKNRLWSEKKGRNYDLSKFKDIIAIVCTPEVVFVTSEATLGFETKGLRRAVSIKELKFWLEEK